MQPLGLPGPAVSGGALTVWPHHSTAGPQLAWPACGAVRHLPRPSDLCEYEKDPTSSAPPCLLSRSQVFSQMNIRDPPSCMTKICTGLTRHLGPADRTEEGPTRPGHCLRPPRTRRGGGGMAGSRPLPRGLSPTPGELLSSFVLRMSHAADHPATPGPRLVECCGDGSHGDADPSGGLARAVGFDGGEQNRTGVCSRRKRPALAPVTGSQQGPQHAVTPALGATSRAVTVRPCWLLVMSTRQARAMRMLNPRPWGVVRVGLGDVGFGASAGIAEGDGDGLR
jgi:hypothetical protein